MEERSLVRGWLMRGTLHLVAAEEYGWMLPLWSARHSSNARRRLGQLGMPPAVQDRALAVIERSLGSEGELSRPQLVARLAKAGIELTAEMRVHLMGLPVVEGLACIGPDRGASGSLVPAEDWLRRGAERGRGWPLAVDSEAREVALAELARRYLGAFAPATERDFASWSGLPLRDCRVGLERIASELVEVGEPLLALRGKVPRAPRSPLVRLLGSFDTYLMGYASRAHAAHPEGERRILPGGGVLRPTICVDGRFVGLWASKRAGARLSVTLEPFERLSDAVLEGVAAEVADNGRFEGLTAALA